MRKGPLGVPRPFVGDKWPFRPPTSDELADIYEYHVDELSMRHETAIRHIDEEWMVVLDEFIPDDEGYQGKVAFALADHVDNWAIYYWPDGEVEIMASSGSSL